jgi:hypothetical protein
MSEHLGWVEAVAHKHDAQFPSTQRSYIGTFCVDDARAYAKLLRKWGFKVRVMGRGKRGTERVFAGSNATKVTIDIAGEPATFKNPHKYGISLPLSKATHAAIYILEDDAQ